MILVISGTGLLQEIYNRTFGLSKKEAECAPGNIHTVHMLLASALTCDQAANTHTANNIMFPTDAEIVGMSAVVGTGFAWTTLEFTVGICLPASNITTVALAIGAFSFATGGATGDVVKGTYQSSLSGGLVAPKDTLHEVAIIQQPTGGIVAGTVTQFLIHYRQIKSIEN